MTLTPYNNEDYMRSEDLLRDGKYITFTGKIEAVIDGCPLTRRLKKVNGLGIKFVGAHKILGLGLSNESMLKAALGDARPDTWIGKEITLQVRKVRAQSGTQPAIRIMPPKGMEIRSGLAKELGTAYE